MKQAVLESAPELEFKSAAMEEPNWPKNKRAESHPREKLRGSLAYEIWEGFGGEHLIEVASEFEVIAQLKVLEVGGKSFMQLNNPSNRDALEWCLPDGSYRVGQLVTCRINLLTPDEFPTICDQAVSEGLHIEVCGGISIEVPTLPSTVHGDGTGCWDVWLKSSCHESDRWTPISRGQGFETAADFAKDLAAILSTGSTWAAYSVMHDALVRNGLVPMPESD